MRPNTIATLDALHGKEWFRAVGVRDTDAADVLSSWDEAIASCGSADPGPTMSTPWSGR